MEQLGAYKYAVRHERTGRYLAEPEPSETATSTAMVGKDSSRVRLFSLERAAGLAATAYAKGVHRRDWRWEGELEVRPREPRLLRQHLVVVPVACEADIDD